MSKSGGLTPAVREDASSPAAPIIPIPEKKFVAVHFPAFVQNVDKALATLGGEEQISKSFEKNSKFMELRFRPSDPYSHPIHGDQSLSSDMILQVTRRKNKQTGQTVGNFQAEIIGTVEKCYRFTGMADFQALAPPPRPGLDLGSSEGAVAAALALEEWTGAGAPGGGSGVDKGTENPPPLEDLHLPPPIFSRVDHPKDYSYRNNANFRLEVSETDPNVKRFVGHSKAATFKTIFLSHNDPLPARPSDSPPADMKETVAKLQKLFQERPMWLQPALEHYLQIDVKQYHAKFLIGCLSFVSYLWRSGPFRSVHCRFDFDPRKFSSARLYQSIDFRTHDKDIGGVPSSMQVLPTRVPSRKKKTKPKLDVGVFVSGDTADEDKTHQQQKSATSATSAAANPLADLPVHPTQGDRTFPAFGSGPKFLFLSPPTRKQTLYQLCDICEPQIQQFLEKCKVNPSCTEKYGWFREAALSKVRLMMKRKLERFLKKEENLSAAPLLDEKELAELDEPAEAPSLPPPVKPANAEKKESGAKRKRTSSSKKKEKEKEKSPAPMMTSSLLSNNNNGADISSAPNPISAELNGRSTADRIFQALEGSLPTSQLSAMHQGIKSAQMHLGEEDVEGFELLDEEDEDEDEEEENHANRNISSLLQNATRGAEDDRADAEDYDDYDSDE